MIKEDIVLTQEERFLIAHAVLEQNYGVEMISSYISDVEQGYKTIEDSLHKKYVHLYDKLKEAGV